MVFKVDGIVVYSIGMTSGAISDQLLRAATSEDYVRQYSNFSQFESEIPAILFDTCEISANPINAEVADIFEMLNLQLGEARVVQLTYPMTDSVLLLDFKPAAKLKGNAELVVYVKCDGSNPSRVFHDHSQNITFEKDGTTPVRLAAGFCKKFCRFPGIFFHTNAYIGETFLLFFGFWHCFKKPWNSTCST